jgi:hypothetical protein
MVVVFRLTSYVEESVERAASSDDFSSRTIDGSLIEVCLGSGFEAPVEFGVMHGFEVTDGDVYPRVIVPSACFDKQDIMLRVFGESVCKNTACRSCSDDDGVDM